ncbi:MAG: hypothetical protein IKX20_01985, partial [Paludibacteraceae bacterium]|nr:hypothetical protein [Paludibacteraceae bacterium]
RLSPFGQVTTGDCPSVIFCGKISGDNGEPSPIVTWEADMFIKLKNGNTYAAGPENSGEFLQTTAASRKMSTCSGLRRHYGRAVP